MVGAVWRLAIVREASSGSRGREPDGRKGRYRNGSNLLLHVHPPKEIAETSESRPRHITGAI